VFTQNSAFHGGAFSCDFSAVRFEDCVFGDNSATSTGGAIDLRNSSSVDIDRCHLLQNSSEGSGGAIYAWNGSLLSLSDTELSGNDAPTLGGAIRMTWSTLNALRCSFSENSSSGSGGALMLAWTGGEFEDCLFESNVGSSGGAVSCAESSPSFRKCDFRGNVATNSSGGAIDGNESSPVIDLCLFSGNSAPSGGALSFRWGSSPRLTACTIADNHGSSAGGGLYCHASSVEVVNSIVWGNCPTDVLLDAPTAFVSLECTTADSLLIVPGDGTVVWLNGCFGADPRFCDPRPCGSPTTDGNHSLNADSPCLPGSHPDGVDCGLIGAFGQGCGPISVEQKTWAGIKARYRAAER
jgi:predicted outer membrane repeat protein